MVDTPERVIANSGCDSNANPHLEIQDLYLYFGGLAALNGVNMKVLRGEIHGLIGPNGSGKTTLLNVLSGVLAPNKGDILFNGRHIGGLPPNRIAERGIGRTFQNIRLFKQLSVLENVLVGAHLHLGYGIVAVLLQRHRASESRVVRRARELIDFVGIGSRTNDVSGSLSYGEQRLVEIARALATEPNLMLLDEPLAGMNPAEVDRVVELCQRMADEGKTILMIDHSMRVVMSLCERITVLNFGKKIAEGTPKDVQGNADVIAAYLGHGKRNGRNRA